MTLSRQGPVDVAAIQLELARRIESGAPERAVNLIAALHRLAPHDPALSRLLGSTLRELAKAQFTRGNITGSTYSLNQALTNTHLPMDVYADLAMVLRCRPDFKDIALLVQGGLGDLLQCVPFLKSCGKETPQVIVLTHFKGALALFSSLAIPVAGHYEYSNLDGLYHAQRQLSSRLIHSQCPRQPYLQRSEYLAAPLMFAESRPILGVHLGGSAFSISIQQQYGLLTKDLPATLVKQPSVTQCFNIILFGTLGEIDAIDVEETASLKFACAQDIVSSLRIASQCDAFVGSDSAVKTMTAMLKVPTIVFLAEYSDPARDFLFIDPYVRDRVMQVYRLRNKRDDIDCGVRFALTALGDLGLCAAP